MKKPAASPNTPVRKRWQTALLILLITALAFSATLTHLGDRLDSIRYPRKFREQVEVAATKYGIEPNLLYAIIKAESNFCETAVSSVGAIGLMQILRSAHLQSPAVIRVIRQSCKWM